MKQFVLAVAGLCWVSLAAAQSATPDPVAERMERARRDAANPLRIIIEASQAKRTKSEAAAAASAAAPAPARAAAAAPAPRPAPRTEAPVAAATAPAERPAAGDTTPVPTAAPSPAPASPAPVAAALEPKPAEPVVVDAPVKLVRYIEPEIPSRIRSRLKPSNEVTVAFQIQPDGSVSNVDIRAGSTRLLDPAVLEAVRQWRYDPLPAAREHTVQLVFNLAE